MLRHRPDVDRRLAVMNSACEDVVSILRIAEATALVAGAEYFLSIGLIERPLILFDCLFDSF